MLITRTVRSADLGSAEFVSADLGSVGPGAGLAPELAL